jgi:hypothetical protein
MSGPFLSSLHLPPLYQKLNLLLSSLCVSVTDPLHRWALGQRLVANVHHLYYPPPIDSPQSPATSEEPSRPSLIETSASQLPSVDRGVAEAEVLREWRGFLTRSFESLAL